MTNILNSKGQRPNVLSLYTDQQRWGTIQYGGNTQVQTTHLDQLAESGAYFDHTFVNCPVCMPSRMSMLSGQYPSSEGVCTNGIEMPGGIPFVQDILSLYGYQTANIGKLHFKNHSCPYRDHHEPYPSY
ncbi:MAG: sulfatase-like hydrolase/transferase [Chloroflexota bacterium]|nr:sulfatase-like hydrolase/transferase [Chloroflexota bacterium]